jgi:hypothetical protein
MTAFALKDEHFDYNAPAPAKLIRTYDRNTYAAEKRDVLERWASHLAVAIAQAGGANVITLRKA